MKELKAVDLSELMQTELPPEQAEQAYRRGYRDGWVQAADAFMDLMTDLMISRAQSYKLVFDHWETDLAEWEAKAQDNPAAAALEVPPTISEEKSRQQRVMSRRR